MKDECNYIMSFVQGVAYLILAGIDGLMVKPGEYLYRDIGRWRCRRAGANDFWMWGCYKGPLGKICIGRKKKPVYFGIKDVYVNGTPTTRWLIGCPADESEEQMMDSMSME